MEARLISNTQRGRAVKSIFRATFVGALILFGWNIQALVDILLGYVIGTPPNWSATLLSLLVGAQSAMVAGVSYRGFRRNLLPTRLSVALIIVLMTGTVLLQRATG